MSGDARGGNTSASGSGGGSGRVNGAEYNGGWQSSVLREASGDAPGGSPRQQLLVGGGPSRSGAKAWTNFEIDDAGMDTRATLADPGLPRHPFGVWKRRYITGVFTLLGFLLFADQNLLAPNLSMAANFFGFDDTQKDAYLGGWVSAAFFAIGAPAALVVGWYTDKVNRKMLLFVVCAIGQVPTLLTIFVTKYWQFLTLRVFTGIAIGGAFPLLYSLMGDMFPTNQRSFVSAFIQVASGAGVFGGQQLAAWIGPATHDWRVPFLVVAVPSLMTSFVMLCTCEDPPRGACEEALQDVHDEGGVYAETITWRGVVAVCKVPSNILVFLQGLPGSLPWGMIMTYLNDYLQLENNLSPAAATAIITCFGAGSAVGVFAGGAIGQALYNWRKASMPLFSGVCVFMGIAPLLYLVNVHFDGVGVASAMAVVGGAVASVAGPNVKAITLNVNEPEARGVALAMQTMTDDLGKALGPFLVAGFIQLLGRRGAFNVSVMGWVPCGALLLAMAIFVSRDEASMQKRLRNKSSALLAASSSHAGGGGARGGAGASVQSLLLPNGGESSARTDAAPLGGGRGHGGGDEGDIEDERGALLAGGVVSRGGSAGVLPRSDAPAGTQAGPPFAPPVAPQFAPPLVRPPGGAVFTLEGDDD